MNSISALFSIRLYENILTVKHYVQILVTSISMRLCRNMAESPAESNEEKREEKKVLVNFKGRKRTLCFTI